MAELTLETINKGREAMGLAPLTELPKKTEDKKEEGRQENSNTEDKSKQPKPEENKNDSDIDDAKLLEILSKRGITAASIDDLKPKPTPEPQKTPEQIAEERENKKLSYSLEKGFYNTKDHENFITDSKNKEGLVFAQFVIEAREEDPTLSDEDLEEQFNAKYGLNAKPESWSFKRGQKEIGMLADEILKNRHKKIYDADNAYANYEQQQQAEQKRQNTIKEKSPVFIKDVNEIFDGLKKITAKISDDESYDIDVTEDAFTRTKAHFLKPEVIADYAEKGWTKDEIKDIAFTAVLRQDYAAMIEKASAQRMLKNQAGARGIPAQGNEKKETDKKDKNLTPEQKKMLEEYRKHLPQPTEN